MYGSRAELPPRPKTVRRRGAGEPGEITMAKSLWTRRQEREGAGLPAPRSGSAGYFYQIKTFFWRFVFSNFLFLLASLPVVTFPAALSALNRVCIKLIRDRNVLVWEEFRDEFKASFKKGLLLGLFYVVWLFVVYYLWSLGKTNWENPYGVLFIAIGVVIFTVMVVWAAYAFVLLASLDLKSLRDLLRTARALMFLGKKYTLGVFGVLLLVIFFSVMLFPFSLIPLLFCGFALTQYVICALVNAPMQTHILTPYAMQQEEQEKQQEEE